MGADRIEGLVFAMGRSSTFGCEKIRGLVFNCVVASMPGVGWMK
jgi:hypothetical protein